MASEPAHQVPGQAGPEAGVGGPQGGAAAPCPPARRCPRQASPPLRCRHPALWPYLPLPPWPRHGAGGQAPWRWVAGPWSGRLWRGRIVRARPHTHTHTLQGRWLPGPPTLRHTMQRLARCTQAPTACRRHTACGCHLYAQGPPHMAGAGFQTHPSGRRPPAQTHTACGGHTDAPCILTAVGCQPDSHSLHVVTSTDSQPIGCRPDIHTDRQL